MTDRGARESTLTVLSATLPLLGELQPLVRELFVAPLAFLVPAVRELSVLSRVRAGLLCPRLTPDRAIAGCGEIHRHGDLHLPLDWSVVRSLRSRRDCHHKNALFKGGMGSRGNGAAGWLWRRPPTVREPPRLLAPQKIRPASQSR